MTELEVSSAVSWSEVEATPQEVGGWVGVERASYGCLETN